MRRGLGEVAHHGRAPASHPPEVPPRETCELEAASGSPLRELWNEERP